LVRDEVVNSGRGARSSQRALAAEGARGFLAGQAIRKVIVGPGRVVNIVAG
jgi:hypothetical protein